MTLIFTTAGQRLGTVEYDVSDFMREFDDLKIDDGLYRIDGRLGRFLKFIFGQDLTFPAHVEVEPE
jgi:hypothetical protein